MPTIQEFPSFLQEVAAPLWRDMPWRSDTRAYYVLVSELMLQQTQVARVIPKFEAFIQRFPDEASLARASLADVLTMWQGLGYNRRAKFLHEAAKIIDQEFGGVFPTAEADILRLPGVGRNTAGAILAYAFNQPALFIETNVRTVYLYHFFEQAENVSDRAIIELLTATIDRENPRVFYQNLMDYGTYLKSKGVRNISQSRHYRKQLPLKGSVREVRGAILRHLTAGPMYEARLRRVLAADERFSSALSSLLSDGLVTADNSSLLRLTT